MMVAATSPVGVCFLLSVSPQCGQVAAFDETSWPQVLQLINFVTDLLPTIFSGIRRTKFSKEIG
jgi:hypothetical protein